MNIITGDSSAVTTQPDESITLEDAKADMVPWLSISNLDGLGNGRKFDDDDVINNPSLEDYALAYVREYDGDFEFMLSMQFDYGKHGDLTVAKIRGVLNCLLAQMRYEERHPLQTSSPAKMNHQGMYDEWGNELPLDVVQVIPVVEPVKVDNGRYCTINPATGKRHFYQVDAPTEGKWKGYTFLTELHIGGSDNGERSIRNRDEREEILQTIAADDEALARYGRETGTCGVCHRTLTDPESVALGIGPICRQGI